MMLKNETNPSNQLPGAIKINRRMEYFLNSLGPIQKGTSEKIGGTLIGYIKEDFENGTETFIPAKDIEGQEINKE